MAVTYTLETLRAAIRRRADLENTDFELDAEIDEEVNSSIDDLHDLLISTLGERYALKTDTLAVVSGTSDYALGISDFYRLVRCSASGVGSDRADYPLETFENSNEIMLTNPSPWFWVTGLPRYQVYQELDTLTNTYTWRIRFNPVPQRAITVNIFYHPLSPFYANDNDDITIPFAEYVILDVAIKMRDKEERDSSRLERERQAVQKRIEEWGAPIDQASPIAPSPFNRGWRRRRRVL